MRLKHRGICAAGLILLSGVAAAQTSGADDPGKAAFQKCYACHSVDRVERNLPGPNLAGVIGRKAASLPDFDYSQAMRSAGANGLVWDRETLDRFLADPEKFLPGTSMSFVGLTSADERNAVIGYLERHP